MDSVDPSITCGNEGYRVPTTAQERALRASERAAQVARVKRFQRYLREMREAGLTVVVHGGRETLHPYMFDPAAHPRQH